MKFHVLKHKTHALNFKFKNYFEMERKPLRGRTLAPRKTESAPRAAAARVLKDLSAKLAAQAAPQGGFFGLGTAAALAAPLIGRAVKRAVGRGLEMDSDSDAEGGSRASGYIAKLVASNGLSREKLTKDLQHLAPLAKPRRSTRARKVPQGGFEMLSASIAAPKRKRAPAGPNDARRIRGQAVSQLMKERGMELGEASRYLAQHPELLQQ